MVGLNSVTIKHWLLNSTDIPEPLKSHQSIKCKNQILRTVTAMVAFSNWCAFALLKKVKLCLGIVWIVHPSNSLHNFSTKIICSNPYSIIDTIDYINWKCYQINQRWIKPWRKNVIKSLSDPYKSSDPEAWHK